MEAARRSAGLILALALLAGCGGSSNKADASACAVDRGVLPQWARTGFSDPKPKMPHVVGDSGAIAAVIFGDPLVAPPAPDRSNKILWVARDTPPPPAQLTIHATNGDQTLYIQRRRWDYFVTNLMGATPPKEYKLTMPPANGR